MASPNFNRERFLLQLVAWILGVQFGIFILAGAACTFGYYTKTKLLKSSSDSIEICPNATAEIRTAAGESLGVLLALLGGGALAANEIQRRNEAIDKEGPEKPRDPLDPP